MEIVRRRNNNKPILFSHNAVNDFDVLIGPFELRTYFTVIFVSIQINVIIYFCYQLKLYIYISYCTIIKLFNNILKLVDYIKLWKYLKGVPILLHLKLFLVVIEINKSIMVRLYFSILEFIQLLLYYKSYTMNNISFIILIDA